MKIGILGGGQLARMMAESAKSLGLEVICIDPDITCSAKFVTEVHHCDFSNIEKILSVFTDISYVTYETENLPIQHIEQLSNHFPIYPGLSALQITQDRLYEKQLLNSLAIPTPEYFPVDSLNDLMNAVDILGYPCVLKTRRNGYDGKGQIVIKNMDDIKKSWEAMPSSELILEKFIAYDFEVSLISVRNKLGETKFYPLTLNQHKNGILRISQAPYHHVDIEEYAQHYAKAILNHFDYVGVMTIEFFCLNDSLIANEIAPRVHNSGHWTIEGAETSQFENHLRAIANLPLGSTHTQQYTAMINCISKEPHDINGLLQIEGLHFYSYGKSARMNRKLGHITICAKRQDRLKDLIDRSLKFIM